MKYNGVIESKLRTIEDKLAQIESWKVDSYDVFAGSSLLQNGVERALQVAVEVMIDISERILALENQPPKNSSAESLAALGSLGIIKNPDKYTAMIRFRNFIVHRYEKVDTEIVYDILSTKLVLFRDFIREIRSA